MEAVTTARKAMVRWLKRGLKWSFACVVLYGGLLLVGLIPVNNEFENATDGITIYVVSNAIHADIIVPRKTDLMDWDDGLAASSFAGEISDETHVAFGWGDRGFFLETKTWDELSVSVTAKAIFWPSKSCVHVSYTRPQRYLNAVAVTITRQQYQQLVDHIQDTFQTNDAGEVVQISGYSYWMTDAFYVARGRYHLFNTCNSWVGRGLQKAGVRVPWFCPMPKTPTLFLNSK